MLKKKCGKKYAIFVEIFGVCIEEKSGIIQVQSMFANPCVGGGKSENQSRKLEYVNASR
ncbi:hypothetical protein [Heyndrickxia coagulans]|jgi:hypothetical protein|uniref:hypothetical protein n=1 Tax=Heyndrickxia coagulans TaxID=1398 RepID=UPI001C52A93E|nr:hypothetical protein [Heyndrickxia coagulans]